MNSRVALVKTDKGINQAYQRAVDLVGGLGDLDSENRTVTIKVGVYDEKNLNYPSTPMVEAVVNSFTNAKRILVAESDNHKGEALTRLQLWERVFSDRVIPFDLSHDPHVHEGTVCGERISFSHVLFRPNVLISLHVLRKGTAGSVFKNLLGLIPDVRKERFHDDLGIALVDIAEAVEWVDFAIIDGTYVYGSEWKDGEPLEREKKDLLVLGRDPVAVETIGCIVAGEDPLSIPSIVEAQRRNLGNAEINKIEVLGEPIHNISK